MPRLYIDIETLPGRERPDPSEIAPPKNYKDPAKIKAYQQEKVEEMYRAQALDSMRGQILCVGFAVDNEPAGIIAGADEFEILSALERLVENQPNETPLVWIGHNIKNFDLQWLWRKAIQQGFKSLAESIPRYRFDKRVVDTAELWAGPDIRAYCKLDDIARFLGFEGKQDMDGSQVYDNYLAGNHEAVLDYCKADVELTRKIHKAMLFER